MPDVVDGMNIGLTVCADETQIYTSCEGYPMYSSGESAMFALESKAYCDDGGIGWIALMCGGH